ncbi:DUF5698 domain-containing protein [Effusibacillus lacus]
MYSMGLSLVLNNLNHTWNLIAYCAGYGTGDLLAARLKNQIVRHFSYK